MKIKLLKGWNKVTLGEIFIFEKKSTIKAGEGNKKGKYKFFTSSDTQSKFIDKTIFDGEYLIFSTGGKAGVHYCNEKFSTSTDCFVVKVDEIITAKYVYYFLLTNIQILEAGFKGAGLKHISKEYLKKLMVVYPENKSVQKGIVSILEKANKVKEFRKEADELTKAFLKSVFLNMFGDPVRNTKKWKTYTIREISNKISDGPFGSNLKTEHYTPQGVRVIRLKNIGVERWIDNDKAFISEKHYQTIKNHTCEPGDVIVGTMGDPNLRACILPPEIKIAVNKADCIQIKPNKKLINSQYLCSLINQSSFISKASTLMHGQTRTRISMSQVASLKIPLPPIELLNQFAYIVKEIERLMEYQKQSKEDIDNLFNNLKQKSFKGELAC